MTLEQVVPILLPIMVTTLWSIVIIIFIKENTKSISKPRYINETNNICKNCNYWNEELNYCLKIGGVVFGNIAEIYVPNEQQYNNMKDGILKCQGEFGCKLFSSKQINLN